MIKYGGDILRHFTGGKSYCLRTMDMYAFVDNRTNIQKGIEHTQKNQIEVFLRVRGGSSLI